MTNFIFSTFLEAGQRFSQAEKQISPLFTLPCGCDSPGKRLECLQCDHFKARILEIQPLLAPNTNSKLPPPFPNTPPPVKKNEYSDEVKQKIFNLYAKGLTLRSIGEQCGLSSKRVQLLIKKAGLPKRPPANKSHPIETKKLCLELYSQGVPVGDIFQQTGVASSTITHWATDAGLTSNYTHAAPTRALALKLYQEGKSYREISLLLGIKEGTIHDWIVKSDVPRNTPRHSPEVKQHCLELYRQGIAPKEIEAATGVPHSTIKRWAVDIGINRGDVHRYPDSVRQFCFELFQEYHCYEKVAALMEINSSTIRQWIWDKGLAEPKTVIPPYSVDKQAECLRLRSQSLSIKEIESLTGISSCTLYRWFQKENLAWRATTFSSAQKNFCLSLHQEQGLTIAEISQKTGIELEVIKLWLREAKGLQNGLGYNSDVRQHCLDLYQSGKTYQEICKMTDVGLTTLTKWVKDSGIKLRRPRYSDEIRQRCIDLGLAGHSYDEISEITGLRKKVFTRWVRIAKVTSQLSPPNGGG
jgi:transposase-like protein